jgi:hypothetical protein
VTTLIAPPAPPLSTVQQATGQIFEDDMSGFPSVSDICHMTFTSSAPRISQEDIYVFSKSGAFDTTFLFICIFTGETTLALSSYQSYEKNRSQKQLHTVL